MYELLYNPFVSIVIMIIIGNLTLFFFEYLEPQLNEQAKMFRYLRFYAALFGISVGSLFIYVLNGNPVSNANGNIVTIVLFCFYWFWMYINGKNQSTLPEKE